MWLALGMETALTRSMAHVDQYHAAVIETRKLQLTAGNGKYECDTVATHNDVLSWLAGSCGRDHEDVFCLPLHCCVLHQGAMPACAACHWP